MICRLTEAKSSVHIHTDAGYMHYRRHLKHARSVEAQSTAAQTYRPLVKDACCGIRRSETRTEEPGHHFPVRANL